MHKGWLVKRARDPEICGSHSRDRAALRAELGLPLDRRLVGIFGLISERKNAKLVFEALQAGDIDADLLLAGVIEPEVQAWIDALPAEEKARIHTFPGFLDNTLLDKLIAAVDVAPIALTNNGPSGIMGKALAAEVPVVSAGSDGAGAGAAGHRRRRARRARPPRAWPRRSSGSSTARRTRPGAAACPRRPPRSSRRWCWGARARAPGAVSWDHFPEREPLLSHRSPGRPARAVSWDRFPEREPLLSHRSPGRPARPGASC